MPIFGIMVNGIKSYYIIRQPKKEKCMEIKTSPRHRKCKYPLCKNILSIYNHETYCHVHLGLAFRRSNIDKMPVGVKA